MEVSTMVITGLSVVVSILLAIIGFFAAGVINEQTKIKQIQGNIQTNIATIQSSQEGLRKAFDYASGQIDELKKELTKKNDELLIMRERNHAKANEITKTLEAVQKECMMTNRLVTKEIDEHKAEFKEHLAKAAVIDIEIAQIKDKFGRVIVK